MLKMRIQKNLAKIIKVSTQLNIKDIQDVVSQDSDILGPDKIREDTNEQGKVTGFGDADTAGNDSGIEDSDEVSESGGTDDTDIAVQITYFFLS